MYLVHKLFFYANFIIYLFDNFVISFIMSYNTYIKLIFIFRLILYKYFYKKTKEVDNNELSYR